MRLVEELRLPSAGSPSVDALELPPAALEAYDKAVREEEGDRNYGDQEIPCHYLGGHAQPIQDPPEWSAALNINGVNTGNRVDWRAPGIREIIATAPDLRLLLQVDSDDLMNVMWGDTGRLYLLMYEADLKAQAYDRAWCVLQCG
ncbi:MAG: DUF1963 domain-containing protein [Polyangiaceae bacterium]|nr:DUF1963 domain-containing protein [Polyangiaceae bacterium]MCW5789182.1 DUF1963 domain-containing protein [Polyangiaceae bacterium]